MKVQLRTSKVGPRTTIFPSRGIPAGYHRASPNCRDADSSWVQSSVPEIIDLAVPDIPVATTSISAVRRSLSRSIVVAYGIGAFVVTIPWFCVIGLTMVKTVEWMLG